MKVELASKKDYTELYELNEEWVSEGISPYAFHESKSGFFKTLNQSSVYVAREGNEIIGFLTCRIRLAREDNKVHNIKKGEEYADLDSLYVKEEYRSKSVGTKLLKKCLDDVKKAGYKRIILSADSKKMSELIKFYKRQGFKVLFTRMMLEYEE